MKKGFFAIIAFFLFLVFAAAAFADAEYDAGLKDYYHGRYKSAVVHLKSYVEKRPDPAAYYLIGYSLYKLRRFDEATGYFNEAYLIDPNFTPEKYGIGKGAPKVKARPRKAKRKAAVHRPKVQRQEKKPEGKKPTEPKKEAHGQSPAPSQKPTSKKKP